MNDEEIKAILTFLSTHSSNDRYDSRIRRNDVKTGVFITEDMELIRALGTVGSYDGSQLTVDFDKKKLHVYCWHESHHNGDHYDYKTYNYEWPFLQKMAPILNKQFDSSLKKEAIKKMAEDSAKVLRDQVLENGGKL